MNYNNHNRLLAGILCSALLAGTVSGCSTDTKAADSKELSSTEASGSSTKIVALDSASMFTDRDKTASYDTKEVIDITLAENSTNTLSNKEDFVSLEGDDTNIDAVIFSKDDLTLNGSGTLALKAAYGHGIVSKDDLVITGGDYHITAAKHALSGKDSVRIADGSLTLDAGSDGIHSENTEDEEKGFIYVAGGDLNITSFSDGLDAEETLQIDDGTMQIAAGDDGIHSDADLIINDGDVQITKSYEGLEGTTITLNGGTCDIKSEDDGLNAANGSSTASGKSDRVPDAAASPDNDDAPDAVTSPTPDANADTGSDTPHQKERPQKPDFDENSMPEPPSKDETQDASGTPKMPSDSMKRGGKGGGMDQVDDACLIQICAGTLTVDAGGDGIDSNGNLTISGGEIHVYGPTNSGNGALDYAGSASISGGTIVAVGASGMAQNFGKDSTQGSMLVTVSDSQLTGELVLTDSKGQTLVSCSPTKEYNSVLISCPELKKGETYTLTTGDTTTTMEMTSLVYGTGEQGQRGGGKPEKTQNPQNPGKPEDSAEDTAI